MLTVSTCVAISWAVYKLRSAIAEPNPNSRKEQLDKIVSEMNEKNVVLGKDMAEVIEAAGKPGYKPPEAAPAAVAPNASPGPAEL